MCIIIDDYIKEGLMPNKTLEQEYDISIGKHVWFCIVELPQDLTDLEITKTMLEESDEILFRITSNSTDFNAKLRSELNLIGQKIHQLGFSTLAKITDWNNFPMTIRLICKKI